MTATNRFRSLATAAAVLALTVPSASFATSGPAGAIVPPADPDPPCKVHWGATYTYAPHGCDEQVAAPKSDSAENGSAMGEAVAVGGILAALVACAWLVFTLVRGSAARVRESA
jgi:hypothetical protein